MSGAARVAVLGAAFKPNSDDVRDSPALDVAAALQREGADLVVHDPKAWTTRRQRHPQLTFADTAADAVAGADAVLLLTEWSEYRELDPEATGRLVAHRRILDGRNVLDPPPGAHARLDLPGPRPPLTAIGAQRDRAASGLAR